MYTKIRYTYNEYPHISANYVAIITYLLHGAESLSS